MVAVYIESYVEHKPNKIILQKIFIDSGADICLAKKDVIAPYRWKKSNSHRIKVSGFNEHNKELDIIAEDVKIILDKLIIKIPIIYQ